MTTDEEPLFRVQTAYTLSQYREYNRTVQKVSGVYRRIYAVFAGYVAVGAAFALLFGTWLSVPLFTAFGALYCWMTVRGLRRAESEQYQREQLTGTVTCLFYGDRVAVTSSYGTTVNPYSTVSEVLETDGSFFLMIGPTSGIILPKEDCSAELEYFIRTTFDIRMVRRTLRNESERYTYQQTIGNQR